MSLYQHLYTAYWLPFFEGMIKNRRTAEFYNNSLITENLSSDEILNIQTSSLRHLLITASKHSSFHQRRFLKAGLNPETITSIRDISCLPIMTKADIRQHYDQMLCSRHDVWTKSTGGSTGEPLHFAYTKESYEWRVAMSKRGYSWAGALPGAKQAYIWGTQLGNIGKLKQIKEKLHHFVDNHLYFNSFDFDEQAMKQCLIGLNRFRPAAIIGYTNPLYNLALYIGDNSKVNFQPQGIICAAEKVHPYQRKVIEQVFGARVFNTYGSREFMLIAAECEKHEGLHVSSENLIVEIIKEDGTPAKDGETGRIIVTDLHNYGMPFIRYEIGDLGLATSKTCSCGRGLPLIEDVVGRSLDVIRTPEGKIIPGEFFPHLFKDYPEIVRFQVIQEKLDHLVIKLVINNSTVEKLNKNLDAEVRKVVGANMFVDYQLVSDIPLTSTGKYRVTISKISGPDHA